VSATAGHAAHAGGGRDTRCTLFALLPFELACMIDEPTSHICNWQCFSSSTLVQSRSKSYEPACFIGSTQNKAIDACPLIGSFFNWLISAFLMLRPTLFIASEADYAMYQSQTIADAPSRISQAYRFRLARPATISQSLAILLEDQSVEFQTIAERNVITQKADNDQRNQIFPHSPLSHILPIDGHRLYRTVQSLPRKAAQRPRQYRSAFLPLLVPCRAPHGAGALRCVVAVAPGR
jgi:hypothetical protein